MYTFTGENPTTLQLEALNKLYTYGDEYSPRGKKIKELRPACIEFTNPLKRVSFLRGRMINPFFQLAESLWILSGRSDVAFLDKFNMNMVSFSDDGVYFNASYGERLRYYGKNDLHRVVINPVDQLTDVYLKLKEDPDTRQAVAVISNPHFDNSSYTIGEAGKDIACNLILTFKIRNNKLDLTVFNRSNDILWGLWGANLAQFSTIQETVASWLDIEVGTYRQITDSLHVYLEDYGASSMESIEKFHPGITTREMTTNEISAMKESVDFSQFSTEPRMNSSITEFNEFTKLFWDQLEPRITCDKSYTEDKDAMTDLLDVIMMNEDFEKLVPSYWRMAIGAMVAYRYHKLGNLDKALTVLEKYVVPCGWKVSMMYFLKGFVKKSGVEDIRNHYLKIVDNLVDRFTGDTNGKNCLRDYLSL